MKRTLPFTTLSLAALAAVSAGQQTPTITFVPGTVQGVSTDCGIVVVGGNGANVFRWTPADGEVPIGGAGWNTGGNLCLSRDGSTISATTAGPDNILRTSLWNGGTSWNQLPGLGADSGQSESSPYGINADGSMVVGLAWISASRSHATAWTSQGAIDLGSTVTNKSSRANNVSDDGTSIIGWQDQSTGLRQGARWIGGVQSLFTWTDSTQTVFPCGEAMTTNHDGSVIAGINTFNGDNTAWRWDASTGQVSLLTNLPGQDVSNRAIPVAMTDDGHWICGSNGGSPFTRHAILWVDNQPTDLLDYLNSLGTQGLSAYTTLGSCTGMSRDGRVIVGVGNTQGGPSGSWIVVLPEQTQSTVGTAYCFGDGTGTPCPCGNSGAAGHGCANSTDSSGAVLTSTGVASVSDDTLKLLGSHMRASNCLYFQGTLQSSHPAYSGLVCAGGSLVRLGLENNNVAGSSCYPKPGSADLPISVRGGIPTAGGTYNYQVWYRDNDPTFCTGGTTNYTNGYSLTWTP
jgi:probable HAF family extracellular repeat protein